MKDLKLTCTKQYASDEDQYGIDFIVGVAYPVQGITNDGYTYMTSENGSDVMLSNEEMQNIFNINHEPKIITLPDGYNGHTMDFYLSPIAIDGNLVKLQVAEEGKKYMSKWWPLDYIAKCLSPNI